MRNRDPSNQETVFHLFMVKLHIVSESTLGVVGNDAWSTEVHEWDVCCKIPYPTVFAELYVPIHLHCTGLPAELQSGANFTLPSWTTAGVLFL
ncbi:uncharacterized protein TNCV_2018101 [Trichonephila clavipes]|nr:uncharacterized protein TNCV_2018101 [Trichonephila clavipes]